MNLAQLARDNAQSRWGGYSVVGRSQKSLKLQHPTEPNRFSIDAFIGPIHYGVGEDQEIDTAWQPTTGAWDWEMTANDFQTYARNVFNVGDLFRFESGGEWVQFDPQSINWIDENTSRQQIAIKQAVNAVVNDDVLEFPQAYGPGRHFQYQNQTTRLQKLITIDNFSDLPAPTVQGNEIWFESEFSLSTSSDVTIWLDGVEWAKENGVRVQTTDRIEFRNADGSQVLWWLDYPRAWDSAEVPNETIGQMEVRRQGGPSSLFITVRIPRAWIESAVFPIFIDPTVDYQVGAGSDDAAEDSSGSITLGGTSIIPNAVDEWAGLRWTGVTIPSGATIDLAEVDFRIFHNAYDNPDTTIDFEDAASPGTFTTTNSDISGRTGTTANLAYGDGSELTTSGNAWVSANNEQAVVTSIVSELQSSYDYSSGSSMVCRITSDSNSNFGIDTYEDSSANAAKLHIEYSSDSSSLTIQDANNVVDSDNVSLSQEQDLVISDSVNVVDSDVVSLVQNFSLSIVDSAHVVTSDNLDLDISFVLGIDDVINIVSSDVLDLSQDQILVINDSGHVVFSDVLDLSQNQVLVVDDSGHVVDSDVLDLVQAKILVVSDSNHVVESDVLNLSQDQSLVIDDSEHVVFFEVVDFSGVQTLVISDSEHVVNSDILNLSQSQVLVVSDSSHAVVFDGLSLSQSQSLGIDDAIHIIDSDVISLSQIQDLIIDDSAHVVVSDNVVLIFDTNTLVISDGVHVVTSDSLDLNQDQSLVINDAAHVVVFDNVILVLPSGNSPATFVISDSLMSGFTLSEELLASPGTSEEIDVIITSEFGG